MKFNKHIFWGIVLLMIVFAICGTLIYLNSNPYILEIGDNALEAVKSINYSALPK